MDEPIDDETFEDWVLEAIDGLPEAFRERLGSVAILVEDRPSAETLRELRVPGLYGLYRGPCLRSSRTREGVRAQVRDTVHHEIAHHFGISDARLRELAAGHP